MAKERLGALIRELRSDLKLTQQELAQKAGLTQGYISHLELGLTTTPSYPTLKKLAKAFQLPVWKLVRVLEEGQA